MARVQQLPFHLGRHVADAIQNKSGGPFDALMKTFLLSDDLGGLRSSDIPHVTAPPPPHLAVVAVAPGDPPVTSETSKGYIYLTGTFGFIHKGIYFTAAHLISCYW